MDPDGRVFLVRGGGGVCGTFLLKCFVWKVCKRENRAKSSEKKFANLAFATVLLKTEKIFEKEQGNEFVSD